MQLLILVIGIMIQQNDKNILKTFFAKTVDID